MPKDASSFDSDTPALSDDGRWAQVKALFELAVTLDSGEWASFLGMKCVDDPELYREVESLLLAHESTGTFLEQPALSLKNVTGLTDVPGKQGPGPGDRVGAYRLEREIGRGGMGAVYLADRADDEFRKRVAIKLIQVEKESEQAIRRFLQERQILARLEHPYIARLLDGGTIEPGMPYLVMEYVQGESLTNYCDQHGLSTNERLELFQKICSAVQYAHEQNIIHRDLKPSNILVQDSGTPKLLDFGIAKILEEEHGSTRDATVVGLRMLTPAYASPEQMHGESATVQSDIYSLGVILYELLCGTRPSFKTVQQSLSGTCEREDHLSPNLRAVVFNAIRVDPAERYESVTALSADLASYLKGVPTSAGLQGSADGGPERISIGVLPFRELGSDTQSDPFLRSAVTDALITRLSKVGRFSVRPTTAILKYSQTPNASMAARELRVKYLVEGTFHTVGNRVRLHVQLVSSETGLAVWAAQFEEQSNDLLRLEDSISEQIAFALIPQLTGEERFNLSRVGTANPKAHECYLRGRYHWSRSAGEPEELSKALVCFMEAIAQDPQYARAHAGVADFYLRLGLWGGAPPAESFAAGMSAARQALELEPDLADAHASLGFCLWAHDRAYSSAEREFNFAIARNPDSANAHHWFGLLNSARGRSQLAFANLERAFKIDPNSPVIAAALGFVHYNAGHYPKALELLSAAARERRKSAVIQEMLAWCHLKLQDGPRALECARRAADLASRSPASLAVLASAETAQGNSPAAVAIISELEQLQGKRYVSGYDRASAYLCLANITQVLSCLREAIAARDWWTCWLGVDPRWDELRTDSRFLELVAQTQPLEPSDTDTTQRSIPPEKARSIPILALVAGVVVLLAAMLMWQRFHVTAPPFVNPEFARLTGDGTAGVAAISPDGNYIAYTTAKRGFTNLWKRKVGSSASMRLSPPLQGDITNIQFTHAGNDVGFEVHPVLQPFNRQLMVVPLAGGTPQDVMSNLAGPISINRSGTHVATLRANRTANRDEIWLIDLKSHNERLLSSVRYPERFVWEAPPTWSADGRLIALAIQSSDQAGEHIQVCALAVGSGTMQPVAGPRLLWVEHLAWVNGTSGLAIVGRQHASSFRQLWYVGYPRGPFRRLGSDIDSYVGASATDSGLSIVSVQLQTLANIYIAGGRDLSHPTQVTPGTGRYFDLSWTPDGRILYASDSTGEADIWSINADGSDQKQLTGGTGLNWAPVASPDGRHIAFHSNRSGSWHIWRMNADASQPVRLTKGRMESRWPHYTPDGSQLLFHQTGSDGMWNIWSIASDGGTARRLTAFMTTHPAVSPKDGKIAAWYSESIERPNWKLAVFGPEGGTPLQSFTPEVAITPDSQLAWNPAGDAITCLGQQDGAWNLWMQPIDGRKPWRLTSFKSGQIYSFDWSKDSKLVYSQGMTTSDVVMLHDRRRGSAID